MVTRDEHRWLVQPLVLSVCGSEPTRCNSGPNFTKTANSVVTSPRLMVSKWVAGFGGYGGTGVGS
jgi:hypothetical protein